MIHEAKLQLLDKFQENVECLNNEGFSEVEAKSQSFSELLPKLTKELEDIYVERLLWMSHMRKDPIHKKIMQTRDNLIDVDFLDQEEALYSEVEKRKFLFKRLLEKRQHYSDDSLQADVLVERRGEYEKERLPSNIKIGIPPPCIN